MSDLSFQLKMDRIACSGCGEELWIGAEVCPVCCAALQPGTESDAHLYRSRIAIFGPILEGSRETTPTSVVPVTDWQYLRYLQDTDLLDGTPLSETARIASALKLETPSEIRGPENRAGTERLIRHADRYRRIVLDLGALRPSGRFDELNPHLLTAFTSFLKLIENLAATLVAWTPTEARAHASAMQAALDRASDELASAREKMEEAFPEGFVLQPPEERIASLIGAQLPHGGELQTLGDLSSRGFDSFEQFMSRGPEGYKYFSDLLTVPLADLPDEMPPALYMLSLLLNELDDPVGIRKPASYFLDVLRDAYSAEPGQMLEAAVKVQKSLGEAGATLATLAPQVDAVLKAPGLPADALRTFLIGIYGTITEGCFRHVTNLLLFGMFVSKGAPRTWEDISDWSTFGDKYQWLRDAGDEPAWVAALEGVERIVRNSDAHHEYELLDGGVRFINRNPQSKKVTKKFVNDEQFGELVRKIVRTILSLSVAAQLFQCDHIREIASDLYGVETPRVLRPTYLQLLLGIVGLLEPEISEVGKKARVRAVAAPYRPPAAVEEYLKGLFFIQKMYPEAEEVSLEVESQGEWYCSMRAPAKSIDAVVLKPDEASALGLLLTSNISSVGQPARSDEEKLVELGLSLGSRLVVLQIREVVENLADPVWPPDLDKKLRRAVGFLKDMEAALLLPLELSQEAKGQRDGFLDAMKEVRRFFSTVLRSRGRRLGDVAAISRANSRYVKATNRIDDLVNTLPPVERIF